MFFKEIFIFLLKYRYWISWLCIVVFISVFLFRFYTLHFSVEATLRCYLTPTQSIMPDILLDENAVASNISDDNRIRIKSFANSQTLINNILDSFDIKTYYGVKLTGNRFDNSLYLEFRNNYFFEINEDYEMTISIKDKNIQLAYDVAKAILFQLNRMNNAHYLNILAVQEMVCQKHIDRLETQLNPLYDSLSKVSNEILTFNASNDSLMYEEFEFNKWQNRKLIEQLNDLNNKKSMILGSINELSSSIERLKDRTYRIKISRELLISKSPVILEERFDIPTRLSLLNYAFDALKAVGILIFVILFLFLFIVPELKAWTDDSTKANPTNPP